MPHLSFMEEWIAQLANKREAAHLKLLAAALHDSDRSKILSFSINDDYELISFKENQDQSISVHRSW